MLLLLFVPPYFRRFVVLTTGSSIPAYVLRWEETPAQLPSTSNVLDVSQFDAVTESTVQVHQAATRLTKQADQGGVLPPRIALDGYLLPGRATHNKVTVFNPNNASLSAIQLQVDCVRLPIEWDELQPNTQQSAEIEFVAPKTRHSTHTLAWTFTCESEGQRWQFEDQVEMPVRQFQISEVDAFFEGLL